MINHCISSYCSLPLDIRANIVNITSLFANIFEKRMNSSLGNISQLTPFATYRKKVPCFFSCSFVIVSSVLSLIDTTAFHFCSITSPVFYVQLSAAPTSTVRRVRRHRVTVTWRQYVAIWQAKRGICIVLERNGLERSAIVPRNLVGWLFNLSDVIELMSNYYVVFQC